MTSPRKSVLLRSTMVIALLSQKPTSSSSESIFGRGATHSALHQFHMSIQEPSQPLSSPSFVSYRKVTNASSLEETSLEDSSYDFVSNSTQPTEKTQSEKYAPPSSLDGIFIDVSAEEQEWPIHNELFEGKMVFLLRANPTTSYDFEGDKNIHWELQIQGHFKRAPGPLYLSIEIPREEKLQISWFMRVVANAFCKLIKFMGYNSLHSSLGEKGDIPHFATPAYQAFDKFVVTAPNQTSPILGQTVNESYESAIRRRNFESDHTIDTSSLYTMSFNDTFFDPVEWQVKGVPLLKPIDMSKFTNNIRFVVYEVEEENHKPLGAKNGDVRAIAGGTHTKRNIVMWFQMHRRNS